MHQCCTIYDNCSNNGTRHIRSIENIPPTSEALKQQIKRASLQADIWHQCLASNPILANPEDCGWKKQELPLGYEPLWTNLPEASVQCQELISCKCNNTCKSSCKCRKHNLPCTSLCVCDGQCVGSV